MNQQEKFTEACLNDNTIADLREALGGPADKFDMETWGLDESQWRAAIEEALAKMLDDEAE